MVRLVLIEKSIPYELITVDPFAESGLPAWYRDKHPFLKVPALAHNEFTLYETGAITRYLDETFAGPKLQPETSKTRARMNQVISILDNYAYKTMVWEIFVERISKPLAGSSSNEVRILDALPQAESICCALGEILQGEFFCGPQISLADLHAAPIFLFFLTTPEGQKMITEYPNLDNWWQTMQTRSSITTTKTTFG